MCARILVVSDIHGSMKSLNRIKASYHKYDFDFIVCCGDITHFGRKEDAVKILDKMPTEVIGITGNCDGTGVAQAYDETDNYYIELKKVEKKGIEFIGLSGSEYSEDKLNVFKERAVGAEVYVFHQPPYGYLDEASRGKHIGSKKLLPIVRNNEPRLILSGHVHEDRGIVEEDSMAFMNPGPAGNDNLGLVDIEDGEVDLHLI